MTNVLSLPLIDCTVAISTNEDWRDAWAFPVAGIALPVATSGNTGNGTIGAVTAAPGAPLGNTTIQVVAIGATGPVFTITDEDGVIFGSGVVGAAVSVAGLSFTLSPGAVAFVIGDSFTIAVLPALLDLTGIAFAMMVRTAPGNQNVLLSASSADGQILNGGVSGQISLAIGQPKVQALSAGSYVFDVVARADATVKVVVKGTLTVLAGITTSS